MRRLLSVSFVALALVFQSVHAQELRTLATHIDPTKEQLALLEVKAEELDAAAAKANVEVVRDEEDILLFDADLYNLRQMSHCIEGFDVLTRLLREGKKQFTLGELEKKDREAVRAILLAQSVGEGEGPALFGDKAPISLSMDWRATLEKDGVTKKGWVSEQRKVPKKETLPVHSAAENEKFAKDELPKLYKPLYSIGAIQFKCGFVLTLVETKRRVRAISKIMALMDDRMAKQDEAFKKKEETMITAYGAKNSPMAGQQAQTLSDQLQQSLRHSLMENGTTEQAAAGFLQGAKLSDARPMVRISISYANEKGVTRTHGVPTRVRRGW